MQDIVLIGPQGSGKGTQSVALRDSTGKVHLSMGNLLRAEAAKGTPEGIEIAACQQRGDIVPTDIAHRVLAARLAQPDAASGALLDGFPRTLEQADMLENVHRQLGRTLAHVIYLNVDDDTALRRLSGRLVCTNRACERNYHAEMMPPKVTGVCDVCGSPVARRGDDTPEAIRHRLSVYHTETTPLIALYTGQGLLREIDGHRTMAEVHADILKAIGAV